MSSPLDDRIGEEDASAAGEWNSFECYRHSRTPSGDLSSGLYFEVRVDNSVNEGLLDVGLCPVCGAQCNRRNNWPATGGGHGSRAEDDLATIRARIAAREVLGELAADMTIAEVIRDLARDRELLRKELREAKERGP